MDTHFIIAQALGIIGVLCFLASYFPKSNRALYLLQALGCVAFGVQFFLLGAYSGVLSQFYIIVRNLMFSMYNHWPWVRWKGWPVLYVILAGVVTFVTWNGFVSIFPMITMTAGTLAMWTNNAGTIRIVAMLVQSPAWIAYDILTGAYSAVINELIVIGSALASIIKYGWKEMRDPNSEFQNK